MIYNNEVSKILFTVAVLAAGNAVTANETTWEDGVIKVHKHGKEICFDAAHLPISFENAMYAYHSNTTTLMDQQNYNNFNNNIFKVTGNEIATAYDSFGCQGKSVSFPISYEESRCTYCWDSCYAVFDDGSPAHTFVKSVNIPDGVVALAYSTCLGSFGYSDPGFKQVLEPGCHDLTQYESHFAFAEESSTTPGKYELLGKKDVTIGSFESEMSTEHWMYGPGGINNAEGGSWYQYIFELLDPTQPRMRFQVGNGGTWLSPTQDAWKPGDPCFCDPRGEGDGCDKEDLTQCTNGCCGSNGCQGGLNTMEGGAGYWLGKLPTPKVKWTIGAVSKCYNYWTNSPLEVTNSQDLECKSMGVIAVSNRLLYPPDGIGFINDGMFGHAWINTPLGKVTWKDKRRALTLIVDTANFKGPVAYILPEFYGGQSKWKNNDGQSYPKVPTFATGGINTGGGAFEWSSVPVHGHQSETSRDIRIPKMQFSFNEEKKTVLMSAGKSWTSKTDLYYHMDMVMNGKIALDESKLLKNGQGYVHPCSGFSKTLRLDFEGKPVDIGGTVKHREEPDGMCSAVVEWDESNIALNCNATHCKLRDSYKVGTESITKQSNGEWVYDSGSLEAYQSIPDALKGPSEDVFPEHGFWLNYDRRKPVNLCGSKPARWQLYCRKTSTDDWIAWRWYAYKNQPGFQRLKLSKARKLYIQRRIVKLHKAMEAKAPLNEWLKTPESMKDLVKIDPKLLIEPPPKLKYGFVPIVVYQGMVKPSFCKVV